MSQLAEQVVRYDLDDLDVSWLQRVNEEREEIGIQFNCCITSLTIWTLHPANTLIRQGGCIG